MAKVKLLIAGVYSDYEGYPNVKYRLEALRHSPLYEVVEKNVSFAKNIKPKSGLGFLSYLLKFSLAHLKCFYILLANINRVDIVYIPYPAVIVCALPLPFISSKNRKKIIIDAFISLYDTVVLDQQLLTRGSVFSKALFLFERYVFNSVGAVMVDTEENRLFYVDVFAVSESQFVTTPMYTAESIREVKPLKLVLSSVGFNVVFVGVLSRLHGIELILEASYLLRAHSDINFIVIGAGVASIVAEVRRYRDELGCNITFVEDWLNASEIKYVLKRCDIGVGVFGSGGKAQRVCPLKIYLYAESSLPFTTMSTRYFDRVGEGLPLLLGSRSATELADKILLSKQEGGALKASVRKFYEDNLANSLAEDRFDRLVLELLSRDGLIK